MDKTKRRKKFCICNKWTWTL